MIDGRVAKVSASATSRAIVFCFTVLATGVCGCESDEPHPPVLDGRFMGFFDLMPYWHEALSENWIVEAWTGQPAPFLRRYLRSGKLAHGSLDGLHFGIGASHGGEFWFIGHETVDSSIVAVAVADVGRPLEVWVGMRYSGSMSIELWSMFAAWAEMTLPRKDKDFGCVGFPDLSTTAHVVSGSRSGEDVPLGTLIESSAGAALRTSPARRALARRLPSVFPCGGLEWPQESPR